jgi:hypothetical protein
VIGPTKRSLPDKTQHSQETDIHFPGGIRTHNPSKRTAADPRLRPRGHLDRKEEYTLRKAIGVVWSVELSSGSRCQNKILNYWHQLMFHFVKTSAPMSMLVNITHCIKPWRIRGTSFWSTDLLNGCRSRVRCFKKKKMICHNLQKNILVEIVT